MRLSRRASIPALLALFGLAAVACQKPAPGGAAGPLVGMLFTGPNKVKSGTAIAPRLIAPKSAA